MAQLGAPERIWKVLTQEVEDELYRLVTGQPVLRPAKYEIAHREYYHSQNYVAAGTTKMTYYNTGAADFTTNLNNGMVPDQEPFVCTGVALCPSDRTVAGALSTARAVNAVDTTSIDAQVLLQDALAAGLFRLLLGSTEKLQVRNLFRLGAGGGFSAAGPGTFTATDGQIYGGNGVPASTNVFKLPRPLVILPNTKVAATLEWATGIAIANYTGAWTLSLIGESVVQRS